jgi:virginiamycin B lyase
LPGEQPKAYAVYVDERDLVWVSDFGSNTTYEFNPASETWTAYAGSGENANVRQILGRPGEIYLPESGTNRMMVVKTGSGS